MAIVVEEEKNKVNVVRLLGWVVVVVVILAAAYYIFFASPELVTVSPPTGFQNITPISQAVIQPQTVLGSPAFSALQSPPFPLPTPQGPAAVGRTDPFLAP